MDLHTQVFEINYASVGDIAGQLDKLKSMHDNVSVSVDARTNRVIVTDIQPSIDKMRELIKTLDSAGVETDAVRRVSGTATGVALISVASDGQNAIVVAPGANMAWGEVSVADVERAVTGCRLLLLNLEVPPEVIARAIRAAKGAASLTIAGVGAEGSQTLTLRLRGGSSAAPQAAATESARRPGFQASYGRRRHCIGLYC